MFNKSPSSSLTGKLLFWVTLITAATLIAVVLATTNVAQIVMHSQIQRRAEAFAEEVAIELATAQNPGRLVESAEWVEKLNRRMAQGTGLLGIDIEVDWRDNHSQVSVPLHDAGEVKLVPFEDVPVGYVRSRGDGSRLETVLRADLSHGQLSIRVVSSTEVIAIFLDEITRKSVWMGVAAWMVLVMTIAVLIHSTIIRPLRRVADAMGEVAGGNLDQQVEDVKTAEIEPLVQSFNRMSNRLLRTEQERTKLVEEIEELNWELQARVEEATAELAEAQEDLARRDRLAAMGELVGTIAHEVGTPLNSVLAHLDMLMDDIAETSSRDRLEIAISEIVRV
ncbi:MAG: HAMP domain-containing protein, partial [Myxococcales bacterium]|nr:HAMP domain-containing protein [Myxococcales bacterium]